MMSPSPMTPLLLLDSDSTAIALHQNPPEQEIFLKRYNNPGEQELVLESH